MKRLFLISFFVLIPFFLGCQMSPLKSAILDSDTPKAKQLIAQGHDPNEGAPLFWAAHEGNYEVAKLLIEEGANVNLADGMDPTPLYEACKNGHFDIAKLLVENGADINYVSGGLENKRTPVLAAASAGRPELLLYLVRNGADIMYRDSVKNNAIHCAVGGSTYAIADAATEIETSRMITYNMNKETARDVVLRYEKTVLLLKKMGVDPHGKNANGRTPFDLMVMANPSLWYKMHPQFAEKELAK